MNHIITNRRNFIGSVGLLAGAATTRALSDEAPKAIQRPKPPYRVWFQPRLFQRDMSLYANMTIDASGWSDPKLMALAGKVGLRWLYGTNHPDARGPEYWHDACAKPENLPGVALDEWVPSKNPAMEGWVAEGLRSGRKASPNTFIAVWFTDPTPTLAALVKDGTVDLAIAETYTFAAARYGADSFMHWAMALRRMDAALALGMGDKTIFSFGHITPNKDLKGRSLNLAELKERAQQIKERYPQAPGIAFFQDNNTSDARAFRDVIRQCDELSLKLWS